MKRNKLKIIHILLIILLIPFFRPSSYLYGNTIKNMYQGLMILDYLIILFLVFKDKKIDIKNNKYIFSMILVLLLIAVSTILNNGNFTEMIKYIINSLMLMLLFNHCTIKYKMDFVKSLNIYFFVLLFINLLTMILYPNGMFINSVGNRSNYFLGFKNTIILYVIPFLYFSFLLNIKKDGKLNKRFYVSYLLGFLNILLTKSSTGIVGLAIITVLLLTKNFFKNIKAFNLRTFIIIHLILFYIIIIGNKVGIFSFLVVTIFKKDLTFTNRTYIWDKAIEFITNKPLLGYGSETSIVRAIKFRYHQAVTCHNQLLDMTYQIGIIGAIIYGISFLILKKQVDLIEDKNIKFFTNVILMSFLVMMLMEYYNIPTYIYLFIMISQVHNLDIAKISKERM